MQLLLRILPVLATLVLQCLPLAWANAHAAEPVSVQLKWAHSFQFAGYYAAQELGYYRKAGLEVELREAQPGLDVVNAVVAGQADFGVGTSALLLAKNAGKPVVALAVIFQHSPQVLIAAAGTVGQNNVHALDGKRVMLDPSAAELLAYLKREGMGANRLRLQPHSFNPRDLIDGKTDAISAYQTNEPYDLDQAGFNYQVYTPRASGIDFYGDNLFTTQQQLHAHPERVRAFRAASLQGWQYAMDHPDELIELIIKKYGHPERRGHLQYEAAQMAALMRTDLVAIGYMNPDRWRHIADTYAEIGMLPRDFPLDDFLFDPQPAPDMRGHYAGWAGVLALALLAAAVAGYIYRINRRLARSMAEVRQTALRLKMLSTAIDQSPTSVVITDPHSVIEYVNPHFLTETGYTEQEVIGKTPRLFKSGQTPVSTYQAMWERLMQGHLWVGELLNRRKSGEIYWEEARIAPVKNDDGVTTHFVAVKLDITERKQIQQRLEHLAHYDVLTGLPNRALLFERIEQSLALARRRHARLALMFVDLDDFKPVNDTHGHATGDAILQQAARRMMACLRDSDTVGRLGGDEFLILLPDITDEDSVLTVADKIRAALCQVFVAPAAAAAGDGGDAAAASAEKQLTISSSIGIALYPQHGSDAIELARNADYAMYQSKLMGGNHIKVFSERGSEPVNSARHLPPRAVSDT